MKMVNQIEPLQSSKIFHSRIKFASLPLAFIFVCVCLMLHDEDTARFIPALFLSCFPLVAERERVRCLQADELLDHIFVKSN